MNFGLKEADLTYIVNTISKFKEISQALIFGSRALDTFKPGSDVDIALIGDKVNFSTVSKLHAILEEESPMPYIFDIIDYTHLRHQKLKSHIDRVGITIFSRSH